MNILRNNETGKFRSVAMTEEDYRYYENSYTGLCVSCGDTRGSCEPDARKYSCDSCEKPSVYGIPELLIMGRVNIT